MTSDRDDALQRLQATWHREIPISGAMGVEVASWAATGLSVRAALAPNVNVHGTAFAGSLYAVAALAGWGWVHLETAARGLDCSIVIARGSIDYRAPVTEDLLAHAGFAPDDDAAGAWQRLAERGRTRFEVITTIGEAPAAATFRGTYAVRRLESGAR